MLEPRAQRAHYVYTMASFVAEVKGVKFHDCRGLRACRGERVVLRRQPYNAYDANCVEVQLQRGRRLLGHLEAAVAARLSPLMRDVPVEVAGCCGRRDRRQGHCWSTHVSAFHHRTLERARG